MSDLVPFVAAIIRDKALVDMQEELKAEKEKNEKLQKELRTIQVTGYGGFPVYAQRHWQYAFESHAEAWKLPLQNSTFDTNERGRTGRTGPNQPNGNPNFPSCPVEEIENCEIHIGGKEIVEIQDFDGIDVLSGFGAENVSLVYNFSKYSLVVDFGLNADRTADHLHPTEYRYSDIVYVYFRSFVCHDGSPFDD